VEIPSFGGQAAGAEGKGRDIKIKKPDGNVRWKRYLLNTYFLKLSSFSG
jgi:hypothetical protein